MQGVSQPMIDDTAAMRPMPNMTVIDTADAVQVRAVLAYAVPHGGPLYIRVGRDAGPVVHGPGFRCELGRGTLLREGADVALLSSGVLLP